MLTILAHRDIVYCLFSDTRDLDKF